MSDTSERGRAWHLRRRFTVWWMWRALRVSPDDYETKSLIEVYLP